MPKVYADELKQSAIDLINDGMTLEHVCNLTPVEPELVHHKAVALAA